MILCLTESLWDDSQILVPENAAPTMGQSKQDKARVDSMNRRASMGYRMVAFQLV